MADSVISALPAVGSLAGADILPVVKGGVTSQATMTQVAAAVAQIGSQPLVSVATGTGNALVASFVPQVGSLIQGTQFLVRAPAANTIAAPTLAMGNVAPKAIVKQSGTPLLAGDIAGPNHWLELTYDAQMDKLVLLNPSYPAGTYFPSLQVAGDLQVPTINGGPLAGFRNRLINGRFGVWQRGTNITCPPGLTYCADRWIAAIAGTTNATCSYASFGSSPLAYPNDTTALIWTLPAGAAFSNLRQRIEGATTFHGQSVVLSFSSKVISGASNLQAVLVQHFGSGGAPSADVNTVMTGTAVLTGNYVIYTFTATLPSANGKTFGNNGDDFLELQIQTSSNAAHTIGITATQFESGPLATPFEFKPPATEWALCQRYYQTVSANLAGTTGSGTTNQYYIMLPVVMRAAPTIASTAGTTIGCTSPTISSVNASTVAFNCTGSAAGGFIGAATATLNSEL